MIDLPNLCRDPMGSPTERALLEAVHKLEMLSDFAGPYTRLSEAPFQHGTKIMSVECRRNDGKVRVFLFMTLCSDAQISLHTTS